MSIVNLASKNAAIKLIAVVLIAALFALPSAVDASSFPGVNGRIAYQQGISDGNLFTINSDGTDDTQLTTTSNNQYAEYSPDGTKIAFYSTRDGDSEIYVMDHDGENLTQLTNNSSADQQPSWSSDGTQIAYASAVSGSDFEIHIMDSDGTNDTQITDNSTADIDPAFSPDNSEIVYRHVDGSGFHDIYKMDADGNNVTALTSDSALEAGPSFSTDGNYIVWHKFFSGVGEIMRMEDDGSNITRLTNDPDTYFDVSYSPDGTKLVFGSDLGGVTGYAVYTSDTDGTNPELVIDPAAGNVGAFSWQPLTLAPTVSSNVEIEMDNGIATLNANTVFSDAYGLGIDASTVEVTSAPSNGSTSVSAQGVITYTSNVAKADSLLAILNGLIFAPAQAQAVEDSFTFRACLEGAPSLCSSSTANVVLGASTPSELADTGASQIVGLISGLLTSSLGIFAWRRSRL